MRVITENNEDALSRIDTSMNISASIHISNLPNSNPAELYNFRDSYKEELLKWVQKAVGYLFFFILLQLSNSLIIPIYISILPLFLLDFKVLLTSYLRSRGGLSKRFFLSAPAITQYCSIVFKVILIYYLGVNLFEPFFFLVPVFVTCCIDFWNRVPKTFECKYLTWLIVLISKCILLVVILNVSLVKHGATDWTWTVVLWPVFAGLCVCFIIMVGIVLFTLGSFLSWVSEEIGTKEFISTVWLLLTLTGSTSSILVLCLHVTRPGYLSLKENYCVYPISFLFFFLISTYLNINNLVDWWTMFFSQNNPENSDIQPIHVNPPPNLSLPQRITQVVKRAPHALMRISSSYFQPIETPKNHKLKKRTLSLKSNIEDDIIAHRRIFSNPMKLEVLSPKAEPEKFEEKIKSGLCSMCYENLPNAVIMECGHGGICYDCSLQLWKTGGHCHMCRGEISQVLQIEIGLSSMVKVSSTTRAVYYDNE